MPHVLEAEAVPACLDAVHELLAALWEEAPAVDGSVRARFATAVAELVANVVEHGGEAAGRSPQLALTVCAMPDALLAVLVDDGLAVPDAGPPAAPVEDMAEDGRGLLLVHLAADTVRYERRDGANRWELDVSLT